MGGMSFWKFVSFLALLQVLLSCSWQKQRQPSVLVVAVDSLGVDQASCVKNPPLASKSAFQILCGESVRFTHAYTPSVLAQPALASLLTARYPHEHGVWHNGSKFLSAKFTTSAEEAVQAGYRTSFFSGGPPIWGFSGLNQGFEIFSDHFKILPQKLYRDAQSVARGFLNWLIRSDQGRPFFSVMYLADLQFRDAETVTDLGELRPKSFESQVREVDESLAYLISQLKARGVWDSMHFVLVGLNGVANPQKPRELKGVNLFSSNSEVALYIKPARKKRDLGLQWKIDKNVSLVDVGATLFEMIGREPPKVSGRELEVISLESVLKEPTAKWDENRMILTESAWAQWRGVGNSRFSMRLGHLLFVFDTYLRAFNTFVDQYEVVPISESDPQASPYFQRVFDYFTNRGFEPWSMVSRDLLDKWKVGSELWREGEPSPEVILALEGIYERRPWDQQVIGWMASLALKRERWEELRKLARKTKNRKWLYFADRALGRAQKPFSRGCLSLFQSINRPMNKPTPKVCDHEGFIRLMMWLSRRHQVKTRDRYLAHFIREYRLLFLDKKIYETNVRNQLLWNVNMDLPSGPDIVELTLQLPEFKEQRKKALDELAKR